MAAYVIVETEVTDPEGYERYKAASPGAVAAARRWYDSERYREARRLREGAARMRMVAVQGVEEPPGA
jgi:uncharacterized protein (DUF1330 family)